MTDIESFRAYCLSFPGTHDAFPFGKATSAYDRDLLVFYAGEKWFCFVPAVQFDCCTIKCAPERIGELQARYAGIGPGWHMDKRHWITVRFDADVPAALVRELIRDAYELVTTEQPRSGRRRKKSEAAEDLNDTE